MNITLMNSMLQIDFYLELSVASFFILAFLKGIKKISWKYPLALVLELIAISFGLHILHSNEVLQINNLQLYVICAMAFMIQMGLLTVTNRVFGGVGWNVGVFLTFVAYLIEHTSHAVSLVIQIMLVSKHGVGFTGIWINSYVEKGLLLFWYLLLLVVELRLFRNVKENYQHFEVKIRSLIPMFTCLVGFGVLLNMAAKLCIFDEEVLSNASMTAYLLFLINLIYDLLCSIFILWLQRMSMSNQYLTAEVELERKLRNQQQQQFLTSKTSIELINQKCHRLKHQIQDMQEDTNPDSIRDTLKQLEEDIMIYNAIVKTGNEVLDVAINEKSLLCEKEGITLTCMLDGRPFFAMDAMDIYQMFTTLLTVAMEKTREHTDQEKRLIALTQSRQGAMIFVQVEGYIPQYNQNLERLNGEKKEETEIENILQQFSSELSYMNEIVEKYNGEVAVRGKDDIWILNLMLRLP